MHNNNPVNITSKIEEIDNKQVQVSESEQVQVSESEQVHVSQEEQLSEQDQWVDSMKQFSELFNGEFINTLSNFTNELDIAFDNIDKSIIKKLQNYIKKMQKNTEYMTTQMKKYADVMITYQDNLQSVIFPVKKVKTEQLTFLDNLILFDNILDFKLFTQENKNTKINICKHLNTLFMSCALFVLDKDNNSLSMEQLLEKTDDFIKNLTVQETNIVKSQPNNKNYKRQQSGIDSNIGNLMQSLLGNTDIMNLAMDLSKDIQTQNINPMSLVSSIMTGKGDSKINNIINKVTNTIEKKLESGEIDKDVLEEQANNIMSNINTSGLLNNLVQKNKGVQKNKNVQKKK